jgi:hypothetical protein
MYGSVSEEQMHLSFTSAITCQQPGANEQSKKYAFVFFNLILTEHAREYWEV